jgi:hypothetical protein
LAALERSIWWPAAAAAENACDVASGGLQLQLLKTLVT